MSFWKGYRPDRGNEGVSFGAELLILNWDLLPEKNTKFTELLKLYKLHPEMKKKGPRKKRGL